MQVWARTVGQMGKMSRSGQVDTDTGMGRWVEAEKEVAGRLVDANIGKYVLSGQTDCARCQK